MGQGTRPNAGSEVLAGPGGLSAAGAYVGLITPGYEKLGLLNVVGCEVQRVSNQSSRDSAPVVNIGTPGASRFSVWDAKRTCLLIWASAI